jgi:hypothetical protein
MTDFNFQLNIAGMLTGLRYGLSIEDGRVTRLEGGDEVGHIRRSACEGYWVATKADGEEHKILDEMLQPIALDMAFEWLADNKRDRCLSGGGGVRCVREKDHGGLCVSGEGGLSAWGEKWWTHDIASMLGCDTEGHTSCLCRVRFDRKDD